MADAQRRAELILEFKDNLSAGANTAAASLGKVDASSKQLQTTAGATEQQFGKLAAQLNNGTKTAAAQASIGQLDGLLKSGKISADQYGAAVGQIQLKSGLASKGSMEAADSIMNLGKQFSAGKISSDEYAAGIQKIQQELNSSQNIFQKFGGAIAGAKELILGVAAAAGIAAAAIGAMKAVFDFAEEGATLNRLSDGFENLGHSQADLEKLRKASIGTISDENLMLQANRAQMLSVTASTDELAQLLQVAAVRGRAMGISTTQAFGDIVTGIGRLSPKILDNIGIITEADTTYENYAQSIGKTADALSDAEKRQALVNKVIADGAKMGPMLDDQASKFERLQTKLDNFGNRLKSAAADAIVPTLDRLEQWSTLSDKSATAQDKLAAAISSNTKIVGSSIGVNDKLIEQLKAQIKVEEQLAAAQKSSANGTDAVERANRREADAIRSTRDARYDDIEAIRAQREALGDAGETIDKFIDTSLSNLKIAMSGAVQNELTQFSDKKAELTSKAAKLRAELDKLNATQGQMVSGNRKGALTANELTAAQLKLSAVTEDLTLQQRKKNETDAEFASRMAALAVQADNLSGKISGAAGATQAYVDNSKKIGELQGQYDEVNKEIAANLAAHEDATRRILFGYAEQQLAVGGLTTTEIAALDSLATEWNLKSQEDIDAMQRIRDATAGLAEDGNIGVFKDRMSGALSDVSGAASSAAMHAEQLKSRIDALQDKTITVRTNYVNYHEQAPGGHSGVAKGGIIAGATGMIARGPTYLVGEGGYQTFAGQGAEGVIPLNDRGINILAEALSRAMERMPASTTNVYASPGVDIITKVSQGLAAQTRQARRAGAGAMGR